MYSKTTFPEFNSAHKINPSDKIYTCGSCFAQEIFNYLNIYKFQLIQHPYGIVFNPLSIARQFSLIASNYSFNRIDLVYNNGLYHSLDHHGSHSDSDPDKLIEEINASNFKTKETLKSIRFLVLTLGSSHFYEWADNSQIVANCHKIPQSKFNRKKAGVDEIVQALSQTMKVLHKINPALRIIISVSPVRYLKEGFIENNRSKAALLLAAEQLCNVFEFAEYFPAYEIFMDDLRDYRYVKEDLVHPDQAAINYILSYFEKAYLSGESKMQINDINQFQQLMNHRVLHPGTTDHQHYINKLKDELNRLKSRYPQLDLTFEERRIDAM